MITIRNDTPPALDIDAVRAFVLVAELQSFTRTAQATGTTQSAVSLKLKRLEARLAARLVERTPRLGAADRRRRRIPRSRPRTAGRA